MLCAELNRPVDKEKRMPIEKWTRLLQRCHRHFSRGVRGEGGLWVREPARPVVSDSHKDSDHLSC